MSINKKNHIDIKCSLLKKTLHSVKSEIFSIKLWRKLTKFYPMTIISSDHENEIQFFRNHIPCPRILKLICRNKWFNPPEYVNFLGESFRWRAGWILALAEISAKNLREETQKLCFLMVEPLRGGGGRLNQISVFYYFPLIFTLYTLL